MLKQKMKKTFAIVSLVSLIFAFVPAMSIAETTDSNIIYQQENGITPRLAYIVDTECDLSIDSTTATVDCWVEGHVSTATKAKVIAELQVKSGSNWIPVAIWTDTQDSFRARVKETKSVVTGHTYRVKGTYTVWEGSQSEEVIVYTDEMTA